MTLLCSKFASGSHFTEKAKALFVTHTALQVSLAPWSVSSPGTCPLTRPFSTWLQPQGLVCCSLNWPSMLLPQYLCTCSLCLEGSSSICMASSQFFSGFYSKVSCSVKFTLLFYLKWQNSSPPNSFALPALFLSLAFSTIQQTVHFNLSLKIYLFYWSVSSRKTRGLYLQHQNNA